MRAPGARLRPVPLPARESPNPCASSAHAQRNSIHGACTLPSRSLVLARPGLTWMHRCEALSRKSSSFTIMGQDERGHGIGRRGHVFQLDIRQGAPLFPLSSAVLADTATTLRTGTLPRLLMGIFPYAIRAPPTPLKWLSSHVGLLVPAAFIFPSRLHPLRHISSRHNLCLQLR